MLRDLLESALHNDKLERAIDELSSQVPDPDPWGFNPEDTRGFAQFASLIYKYFRPQVTGIENVPSGRVLIVPNHSGQLPFDGLVVGTACLLIHRYVWRRHE